MPASERRFRQKQADEQLEAGIGKSLWRREQSGVTKGDKMRNTIAGFKKAKEKLELKYNKAALQESIGQTATKVEDKLNVDELTKLEEDAKALLEKVRKEKNSARRQKHLGKKSRRKMMRAEASTRMVQLSSMFS